MPYSCGNPCGIKLLAKGHMQSYANKHGRSGVVGYEIHPRFIRVWFAKEPSPYTYSIDGVGSGYLEEMKKLAKRGKGLSTFISRFVHDKYDKH